MERLLRSFLEGDVLDIAPALLGCLLTGGGVTLRLTEVEAYAGYLADPGSHAFRGMTPRTKVMFGPPGHLYVYFSYGMHYCANVVCGPQGRASAVLLRAGEVVEGHEAAAARRPGVRERDMARGPARLTMTLGLGREDNGADLCSGEQPRLERPTAPLDAGRIRTGPRVGVSGPGGDGIAYPWRFWLEGEPTVSAYRAGVTRRRKTVGSKGPDPTE